MRVESFCAFVIFLFALSAPSPAQQNAAATNDPIVMSVGGKGITVAELCSALASLPPPQRKGYASHPALAKDWYGPLLAMAEEARREHLQVPRDAKLSEVDRDNALVGELIQAIARVAQPADTQVDNYYSEHEGDFEQVKARHILISDATALRSRSNRGAAEAKDRAYEIATRLKGGGDFAELAAKDSDDPYTANKGGDLGYVTHHQLEPAIDSTLWSLAPGQTSAPFEGRFGYEIVRVEERRTQPLADVRESIVGKLKAATLEQRQQAIVAAANITMDPAYVDAPLPCEDRAPSFTLKDPPLIH